MYLMIIAKAWNLLILKTKFFSIVTRNFGIQMISILLSINTELIKKIEFSVSIIFFEIEENFDNLKNLIFEEKY